MPPAAKNLFEKRFLDFQKLFIKVAWGQFSSRPFAFFAAKINCNAIRRLMTSSKDKAKEFYDKFVQDYEKSIPSTGGSLKNSIDRCLTFYVLDTTYFLP
jgi:hypothetical protein